MALRLKELALMAGCSLPHLHDLFRRHLATSPHQWLIQRRLSAAQERLLGSRRSIKEIAHECGFHDPAAFLHAFKRRTGKTPAAFRAEFIAG
jgi:AraC family transcriptional regulator